MTKWWDEGVKLVGRIIMWVIVSAAIIVLLPLVWALYRVGHPAPHPLIMISTSWEAYGVWVSGITTPVLLLIAIVTFVAQRKASDLQTVATDRQIEALTSANDIATQSVFLQNFEVYANRIDYLCEAALHGGIPQQKDRSEIQWVRKLTACLEGTEIPPKERTKDDVLTGIHYLVLSEFVKSVFAVGEKAEALGLLDLRIWVLQIALRNNPSKLDMDEILKKKPDATQRQSA